MKSTPLRPCDDSEEENVETEVPCRVDGFGRHLNVEIQSLEKMSALSLRPQTWAIMAYVTSVSRDRKSPIPSPNLAPDEYPGTLSPGMNLHAQACLSNP